MPCASLQTTFADLLQAHRGIVYKVAHTYCRHPDDREDLVQEIAAQLWRAYPSYDAARPFSTWMYRIALNVAISQVRSNSDRVRRTSSIHGASDAARDGDEHSRTTDTDGTPLALQQPDSSEQHATWQQRRTLHAVIDRQPPLDRALLLLWLEDRSQREIADVLGISESNVATKLHRLKQRIRDQLTERVRP